MKFFAALAVFGILLIGAGWHLKQRHQAVAVHALKVYGESCAHYGERQAKIAVIYEAMPTGNTLLWLGVGFVVVGAVGYGILHADRKKKEHEVTMKAMEGSDG